jgi:hypothetical protein
VRAERVSALTPAPVRPPVSSPWNPVRVAELAADEFALSENP